MRFPSPLTGIRALAAFIAPIHGCSSGLTRLARIHARSHLGYCCYCDYSRRSSILACGLPCASVGTQSLIVGSTDCRRLADDFGIDALNVADDFSHAKAVKPMRQNVRRPGCNGHMRHFLIARDFCRKRRMICRRSAIPSPSRKSTGTYSSFRPSASAIGPSSAQLRPAVSATGRRKAQSIASFSDSAERHILIVNVVAISHLSVRRVTMRHTNGNHQQDRVMAAAD